MRMWDAEILFLGSFYSFFSSLSDCARVCMSVFHLVEVAAPAAPPSGEHWKLTLQRDNKSSNLKTVFVFKCMAMII